MPIRILTIVTCSLAIAGPVLLGAPSSAPPAANAPAANGASLQLAIVNTVTAQQRKAAIVASKALFKSGDIAGGEAALFAANRYAEGTAAGYRESGSRLITMACIFHQEGDSVTATKVAKAALGELEQGRLAAVGSPALGANIDTEMGFVHEQLYGTRQQAEADYQAAVTLSPSTTKMAANALSRMQRADAVIAQRAPHTAGN